MTTPTPEPTTEADAMRAAAAARYARDYGPPPADDEVRQLVVHPAVWPHLTDWLNARGIDVNLMTPAGVDLATYVMSPRSLDPDEPVTTPDALRRAQLRKLGRAMTADAATEPPQRPQERPTGVPQGNDPNQALSEPQTPAQASDASEEPFPAALRAAGYPPEVVPVVGRPVDDTLLRFPADPETARAELHRIQDVARAWRDRAEQAEAIIRRVRQMAHAWQQQLPDAIRRDTAVEALLTATEAFAALDGTDTPTETR